MPRAVPRQPRVYHAQVYVQHGATDADARAEFARQQSLPVTTCPSEATVLSAYFIAWLGDEDACQKLLGVPASHPELDFWGIAYTMPS